MLVCFRGHSHIESSHSLCQIDATGWVDLALWCYDFTHEISNFVKILFNFKKKNISLNRGKPENSFIAKNQKFELITCHFKNLISPKSLTLNGFCPSSKKKPTSLFLNRQY